MVETTESLDTTPAGEPVGHSGARVEAKERPAWAASGLVALLVALALMLGSIAFFVWDIIADPELDPSPLGGAVLTVGVILSVLVWTAITVVLPGQTKVLTFFGDYVGTVRRTGISMVMPLTSKKLVSVRVNNFETNALKVNDADGNPVDIAAIIVWQVADTASATFAVEDYQAFVKVQAEAALRHVATSHPYDDFGEDRTSLRGSTDVVSHELAGEVAERVVVAGVEIIEVRISHLAYAPEIAQAMLQRQQASAIVAARSQIVEGAVGMVDMALGKLEEQDIVILDDERRAAMVSNLLVVLCGDQRVTPIVNSGSLYS